MFTYGFFTQLVQTGLTHLIMSAKNISTALSDNAYRLLFYGKGTPVYSQWLLKATNGLDLLRYKSGL